MNDKDLHRLLRLCTDMADIIYRHQGTMKPREADKARQARQLIKKWKQRAAASAPTTDPMTDTSARPVQDGARAGK